MSNSLDPDQAQHFVAPDLGPNCLQRLFFFFFFVFFFFFFGGGGGLFDLTAMVMSRRSVDLTTLFPGQA